MTVFHMKYEYIKIKPITVEMVWGGGEGLQWGKGLQYTVTYMNEILSTVT